MSTDTPRTDKAEHDYQGMDVYVVDSEFAQGLERELVAETLKRAEAYHKILDYIREIEALEAERDQLRARVAAMEAQQRADTAELKALDEDKARLDWLEQNPIHRIGFGQMSHTIMFNDECFVSLRAAIDAARKAQP